MKENKLSFFAAAILIAAGFSCSNNGKKDTPTTSPDVQNETKTTSAGAPSKLEGTWIIRRAEGSMAEMNTGTEYQFSGNKLSFGKDGYLNPGHSEITDSTFSFQADGNEYRFMYDYHFNGDTLVISMQKSGGQVFHLVKK